MWPGPINPASTSRNAGMVASPRTSRKAIAALLASAGPTFDQPHLQQGSERVVPARRPPPEQRRGARLMAAPVATRAGRFPAIHRQAGDQRA